MKKQLLLFCLCAVTLAASGSVTVSHRGVINSKEIRKELKAEVYGTPLSSLRSAAPAENQSIITTPPEGQKQMMLGSSMTFYIDYGEVMQDEAYGVSYETIFCDDGSVYLKNPVSMLDWDTYIKGQVTEDGIEFALPQPIFSIESEDDMPPIDLMVDVLQYAEIEDPNNPEDYIVTFVPAEDTRSITFVKQEDGSYLMDGDYMMGITWENQWQGFGEMQLLLEPFDAVPIVVPAGLEYDYSYILADEINGWDHTIYRPIGIAYDGDDVYIAGVSSGIPEAVIKGTFDREASTLTIPSDQFMGDLYNHYIFMMAGEGFSYYDEDWEEDMISFDITDKPLVFNFDAENKVFTPMIPEGMENVYIIFNFGNKTTYPCEYYAVDRIYSQGELTNLAPIDPEILDINDISYLDPNYSYAFEFLIYGDNADGQILRDECIYYNIFINGELYTFTTEEYPELAAEGYESLTDVPVFLNVGDDIFSSGNYHGIALRTQNVETVGVRAVYKDGDKRGESKIVAVDTDGNEVTGINDISTSSETVVKEYFDMFGRKVNGIQPGTVTIERSIAPNGSVSTRKVIR